MKINEIYYAAIIDDEICGNDDYQLIYNKNYSIVEEGIDNIYCVYNMSNKKGYIKDGIIEWIDGTKSPIQVKKVRLVYDES